jgi:peptidyl-prolyl cis-trans isomerase C
MSNRYDFKKLSARQKHYSWEGEMKKAVFLFIIALLLGCAKEKGDVLVNFDGGKITVEELKNEINKVPEFAKGIFEGPEGKRKFLDDLISRELIYLDAKKKKIDKDKEYLDMIERFKKDAMLEILLKREIEDKAKVDESELKAYYDANPQEFRLNEEIRASHILVKTEEEARDILKKLKEGADFKKLAMELSQDPGTSKKGGDLGYFGKGKMNPEFERAAIKLKEGELSEPVRTNFGYHIIKLTGRKQGQLVEYTKVTEILRQRLTREKQKKVFEEWIAGLKKDAKININEQAFKSMTETKKDVK